jgi:hypothetical protein
VVPITRTTLVATSCGRVVTDAIRSAEAIGRPSGGSRRSQVRSAARMPDRSAWNGGPPDSPPRGASLGPDCSRDTPTASGRPHRAGTRLSRHARSDRSAVRGTHGCSGPNAGRCSRVLGSWPSPCHLWPSAGRWHQGGVLRPRAANYVPLGGFRHRPTVGRSTAGDVSDRGHHRPGHDRQPQTPLRRSRCGPRAGSRGSLDLSAGAAIGIAANCGSGADPALWSKLARPSLMLGAPDRVSGGRTVWSVVEA